MELNYSEQAWTFKPECPCDLDFINYLRVNNIKNKSIFHFGTGDHHIIGKDNYERSNPNEILAVTTSKDEYLSYCDFILQSPIAANYYKVLFADIYTLSPKMLPCFDLVTLFHLAEFYDDYQDWGDGIPAVKRLNSSYARLNDRTLLDLFVSKLNPDGRLLFFTRSDAFVDKPYPAATLVNEFISCGRIAVEDRFDSLLICRTGA
jgi:hypothetical protein